MTPKKLFVLALICGLGAALATNYYLQTMKKQINNVVTGEVVVARTEIPAKTVITQEMVEKKVLPKEYIHAQAERDLKKVVGRITLDRIVSGEQVLGPKLVGKDAYKEGLAYTVPKGKRALTIGVNNITALNGLLKPGDRVDVITVMSVPVMENNQVVERPLAKVYLENVEVLAVDSQLTSELNTLEQKAEKSKTDGVKSVTLAVTPEEAAKLALINRNGVIQLALRSPVDQDKNNVTPYLSTDYKLR
ncbi:MULTISPECIES: Flp pilus assembly protein CpaB [Carboxydocella]|uniref:Pilus assembly protein CpaB n=2 Tax=Carboxydocella TaxID=178898 RepID=A0A1T4RFC2_9FIRM|nr:MULTISPECIES: Flp pilus assembly protein CpaB [Carboxydocella]AVX21706.1 pilus assembly protein CpaB [Carboxydocella thermautotrophica]AVX32117.1 pilus assembly protein CpaB [Carboxydocella thermautotrophica]SKA14371.1 pilus assembly protein CpaB [Carboxydocella sporoproducens DSM 16521]GAW27647.1 Flp pilus assembly protein CpaB [Carboxydocella sp. ULO1]GAW31842.1 Flp pilus assembly protein CpaB [Carboxydocella sp. JDF658]